MKKKMTTLGEPHEVNEGEIAKMVSLKTIAKQVEAHRSTVRRWLSEAGVQPLAFGSGPKGGLRYRWTDIVTWVETRAKVR